MEPRKRKLRDGLVLLTVTGLSALICWTWRLPWMITNILLMGVPLGYLCLQSSEVRAIRIKFVAKVILFGDLSLLYLCEKYGGWYASTSLGFRLPGNAVIEEVQFTLLYVPLVIAVNERFFADQVLSPQKPLARKILLAILWTTVAITLLPVLHFAIRDHVYFKIWGILYTVIPIAAWVTPSVIREFIPLSAIFFCLNLSFELIALKHGYWGFQGQYFATVNIFRYTYPIEEFVFYVVLSAPAVSAIYSIYKNWKRIGYERAPDFALRANA